jgi:muramidase (phage lysozyme)
VVNRSSGAAGAYQFMPGTWNSTARSAGRSDLVGVHPASASPADQDAMAQHLLATQGLGPWGGACR